MNIEAAGKILVAPSAVVRRTFAGHRGRAGLFFAIIAGGRMGGVSPLLTAMRRVTVVLLMLALCPPAVFAADLERGETVTVVEVVDGDTVVLDREIGRSGQVRLVGIEAPKPPLGRSPSRPWPPADAAKATLEQLVAGKQVTLFYDDARIDRYGRLRAHLYRDDGLWVQGEMLRRGMARVHTYPDNRALAAEMLALEREARAARRGLWRDPFYVVRTPEQAADLVDSFQIVEGRVLNTARVKSRVYLNFGDDWRTDFTVSLPTKLLPAFDEAGIDPLALKGKVIRVRGWLTAYNGPMIDLTHPEQIEVVGEPWP
jgi:endonuclease YncB( thermonuclease family)